MSSTTSLIRKQNESSGAVTTEPAPSKWSVFSTGSKIPYLILGTTAVVTGAALYVLNQSERTDGEVATYETETKLAQLGALFIAGKALLVDGFARAKLTIQNHFDDSTNIDPNSLEGMKRRVQYLNSLSPIAISQSIDETDTGESSSDASAPGHKARRTKEWLPEKQSQDLSNRELMLPLTDEYLIDSTPIIASPVAVGYDSKALDNGNVAFILQQARSIYLKINDQQGGVVTNKFLISGSGACLRYTTSACYNPKLTTHQGNILSAWSDSGDFATKMLVMDPLDLSTLPLFSFRLCPDNSYMHYCLPEVEVMANDHVGVFSVQSGSSRFNPSQISNLILDSSYAEYSGYNHLPLTTQSVNRTMAVGSYSDSSLVTLYEQDAILTTSNLVGQQWNSWGWYENNPFSLGKCFAPKSVNLANDQLFVSCLQSPGGLQGFGLDKTHQKGIAQFTISPDVTGGFASHDLAVSPDGKLVFSTYISNNNSNFSIYDENGNQQGISMQANTSPGVTSPKATITPNGNLITSFLRNNILYGRTFEPNAPPVLAIPFSPQNTSVNTFFLFQIPPGAWIDPNGHNITISATLPRDGSNSTWLTYFADNFTFVGTPPQGSQETWISDVIADDGYFNGIVPTEFLVNVVNRDPILDTLPKDVLTVNVPYRIQLNATDPDGDPITFTSTQLPKGSTLSPSGLFEWTPTSGQQGSYQIPIFVSDDFGGSTNRALSPTVRNRAPIPSLIQPRNFTAGVFGTFTLEPFEDPDGDPIIYSVVQTGKGTLPLWATFVDLLFTGTPLEGDIGPLPMNFTGSDGHGGVGVAIGDFHVVPDGTSGSGSNIPMITFVSGVVGITLTLFGCVYKSLEKRMESCYTNHIRPCPVGTLRKVRECWSSLAICPSKTKSTVTMTSLTSGQPLLEDDRV